MRDSTEACNKCRFPGSTGHEHLSADGWKPHKSPAGLYDTSRTPALGEQNSSSRFSGGKKKSDTNLWPLCVLEGTHIGEVGLGNDRDRGREIPGWILKLHPGFMKPERRVYLY